MSLNPEELGKRIKEAQAKHDASGSAPASSAPSSKDDKAGGRALRVAADLTAGLVVGAFMGYWIDKWLHTKPLFMIIMFFLGFAAGFLNIYRAETGQYYKTGFKNDNANKE